MKIAVTYENGNVYQHFGHTEQFKVYTIEDGIIAASEVCSANGNGHGALSGLLSGWGVSKLICGGIGAGAKNALREAGIEIFGGVSGNTDKQVEIYLRGELSYNPDMECDHHGHEQACGHHGDSCGHDHTT